MWNNLVSWHRFGGGFGGVYDRMGLVSGGFLEFESPADRGEPRPSWFAFQALAARTDEIHAERLGPVEIAQPGAYASAYRNRETGVVGWVAWADSGSVTVERDTGGVPLRVLGLVTDAEGVPARDDTVPAGAGGVVPVELDADPVWLQPVQ